MKKNILFLFFLFSIVVKAQVNGNFTIDWDNKTTISSETTVYNVPRFQLGNFYFDELQKNILFITKSPVKSPVDERSLQISNVVYESISLSELGDLNPKTIPNQLVVAATNSSARDDLYLSITVSPIIKDGNNYKRVKSFSYNINNKSQNVFNARRDFNTISNSVLTNGDWYRFYIEKSGVYKISKNFLEQLGINFNNVDPRNIKIYGNGGKMVPLLNIDPYSSDLEENAIQIIGESDGVFDNQDYILFYAEGLDNWSEENKTHNNLYDSKSYYYVIAQGTAGKRIAPIAQPSGSGTVINTFDDYQFHELDLTNVARLGRKWFGEQFNSLDEENFDFSFPGIVTTAPINITVAGAGVSFTNTKLDIKANATSVGSLNFARLFVNSGIEGNDAVRNFSFPASENVKINLKYDNGGVPGSKSFLNYIILKAKRNLSGYGNQYRFEFTDAATMSGVGEYQISNAAAVSQIWDITDIYNVTKVENSGQSIFFFKATLGEIRKYIALDATDFYSPKKDSQSKVANQNLKGTIFKNPQGQFQDIDYLIITPAFLNSSAEKLASFHRSYSNLNVKVVNLENIYQEFASGKQDIGAIRNFVKYVYRNASSNANRLKYLNLFGDASFDFKNRITDNTNIVPIFHALDSFSLLSSYISDDFFVLLDDNEGNMDPSFAKGLDVAVGRMLVSDVVEAEEMVNKVIEYHDVKSYGRWRNNFVLISDDVDVLGEQTLEKGLDALGDDIFAQKPFVNVKKIHSDAYIQETSAGGNRYPKVREDFMSALEQGALVFNYFGHGGEEGLAKERIYEKADGQNVANRYKYPLFVTITCEFTRFDNPFRPTAGELLYNNPKGGAVSLVTTTRQIFIGTGQDINKAFSANLYGFGSNNLTSIAEALRKSKADYFYNPLMVFYIGDPALKLAIPKPRIVLTKINDVLLSQPVDTLRALSTIKLSGEVRDESGNSLLTNYNGDLAVNIFDKTINRTTLGNDGVRNSSGQLELMNFNILGETIFRGNATVTNGLFEFTFVVPKDIRVPVSEGRISFYAKTPQLEDQTGFDTSVKIGGINSNAAADNLEPRAKLYMNDETFISGGITNESPIFLAFLEDENGINTASGIGHDIVAILDGDETKPYILNDYYETELDNYTKGKLKFPLKNLSVGLHTITFKAWDVYNNPITLDIQFVVVGNENITLTNVLNYPNPFVSYTQFWFTHNRPFEPLEVQVQVMTITGKVVWSKNQIVTTDGFLSRDITWDGKDDFGDRIGKGVYIYKLTVKSTLTNKKSEKFEKLVIL